MMIFIVTNLLQWLPHKKLYKQVIGGLLFFDVAIYAQKCDPYQRVGKRITTSSKPLNPILAQAPFEKWGIDFVGPIEPPSCYGRKCYIFIATEYITVCLGCPKELVSDRGTHFINSTIKHLTNKYLIKHCKSSPYHPKANGQTEKTNGILYKIITKIVQASNNDWDERVLEALWAYRIAYKVPTKHTPFQLVYNQEAIFPIELEVPSL